MDLWFLSDIHLKTTHELNSKILLQFLLSLKNKQRPVTHLIFLGDIFDLWIGKHKVFVKRWHAHLEIIKNLISEQNVKVIFVEGNHDVHVAPYWVDYLGAQVFTEPTEIQVGHYKIHLEHGDLINQNDLTYLKYRKTIRSAPLKFLGMNLPGIFWDRLGNYMSKKSGEHSRELRVEQIEQMRAMVRAHAIKLAKQKNPPDYVFTGHFHVQDDFLIQKDKPVHSINLGSWLGNTKIDPYINAKLDATASATTADVKLKPVYHLTESGGKFIELGKSI